MFSWKSLSSCSVSYITSVPQRQVLLSILIREDAKVIIVPNTTQDKIKGVIGRLSRSSVAACDAISLSHSSQGQACFILAKQYGCAEPTSTNVFIKYYS